MSLKLQAEIATAGRCVGGAVAVTVGGGIRRGRSCRQASSRNHPPATAESAQQIVGSTHNSRHTPSLYTLHGDATATRASPAAAASSQHVIRVRSSAAGRRPDRHCCVTCCVSSACRQRGTDRHRRDRARSAGAPNYHTNTKHRRQTGTMAHARGTCPRPASRVLLISCRVAATGSVRHAQAVHAPGGGGYARGLQRVGAHPQQKMNAVVL